MFSVYARAKIKLGLAKVKNDPNFGYYCQWKCVIDIDFCSLKLNHNLYKAKSETRKKRKEKNPKQLTHLR